MFTLPGSRITSHVAVNARQPVQPSASETLGMLIPRTPTFAVILVTAHASESQWRIVG